MEALAEQLIATYLTRGGKVFIVPQYPVLGDDLDSEWSCPDFVALNFEKPDKPEIIIVEVATGWHIGNLLKKVLDRENQWFGRTRSKLLADGIAQATWPIRFLGFVRRDNLKKVRHLEVHPDVAFAAIEDATFSWDYWDIRKGGGLPK